MSSVHTAQKGGPDAPGQWVLLDTLQAGDRAGRAPTCSMCPLPPLQEELEKMHTIVFQELVWHTAVHEHTCMCTHPCVYTCTHSHVCTHVHSHATHTLLCAHCTRVSLRVMAPASKSVAELPPAPGDTVPALALLGPQTLPIPTLVPPARNAHPSGPWVSGHSCPVLVHPLSKHAWSLL